MEEAEVLESRAALGQRVRALRKQRELTLAQLGSSIGLTASSLSKIEKGSVSISFDTLARLAASLRVGVADLFERVEPQSSTSGRLAITRKGEGRTYETRTYIYRMLCTSLLHKRLVPMCTTIKAGSVEAFGPLIRHPGEEFLYVLQGSIKVITELYEPAHLSAGDSLYLDSTMAHGVVRADEQDAEVLWVSLGPEGNMTKVQSG